MTSETLIQPDFTKFSDGLVPAIVQDAQTGKVLMLGYMNEAALAKTQAHRLVTFYSRSRQRLWTKGEESGNTLQLVSIALDCDKDALLVKANPAGPVCHTGADTCWNETNISTGGFLQQLEAVIASRISNPIDGSYTASLLRKGINKIAQKVGEEAVELVIESKDDHAELFLGEAADLVFHIMVLLQAKGFSLGEVEAVLRARHIKKG